MVHGNIVLTLEIGRSAGGVGVGLTENSLSS